MDENRKKVIIKEILYWKDSRLLPEQYCDYLLTLYTEGNRPIDNKKEKSRMKTGKSKYLFLLLIPIVIFLTNFTELSFVLQMCFYTALIFLGLFASFYFSKKGLFSQIPLIVSAFILLLGSVEMISVAFPNQLLILCLVLVINCFLWIFTGWKLKLVYFTVSGYLGIVVLALLYLYNIKF